MNAVFAFVRSLPKRAALLAIQFYRAAISPIFGPCCRYVPTCSSQGATLSMRAAMILFPTSSRKAVPYVGRV